MDQISDSSVIANTELKKVDLHNNVNYTILQLEYMLIICKRVVTIFRVSFFFILAYCRSKRIIADVIALYISHCTQTENAHILSTVKLPKFWNKCCESKNQLWQDQASALWGLGVEIKRHRNNDGFILVSNKWEKNLFISIGDERLYIKGREGGQKYTSQSMHTFYELCKVPNKLNYVKPRLCNGDRQRLCSLWEGKLIFM